MSKLLTAGLVLLSYVCVTWAKERCCPGVEPCFSNDPPFGGLPLPDCADSVQPSMQVYTKANPSNGQVITRNTIPPIFDGSKLTIFLVHGWLGEQENRWLQDTKDILLKQGDYNAIVVGWAGGSQQLWYPQSVSDTRTVGAEIALVAANVIANAGSDRSRLYCVGHSLGSHVCGHAGMRTKFGRITGLDPAGPLFENRDWTCGLNPSSADLVDVIHSNGEAGVTRVLNLGTMKPLGHIDFYPNGGGDQPKCILDPYKADDDKGQYIDLTPACSHFRAVYYYMESILTPCFWARQKCTDAYKIPRSCTKSDVPYQNMGFPANKYSEHGIFYLETTGKDPFCLG